MGRTAKTLQNQLDFINQRLGTSIVLDYDSIVKKYFIHEQNNESCFMCHYWDRFTARELYLMLVGVMSAYNFIDSKKN